MRTVSCTYCIGTMLSPDASCLGVLEIVKRPSCTSMVHQYGTILLRVAVRTQDSGQSTVRVWSGYSRVGAGSGPRKLPYSTTSTVRVRVLSGQPPPPPCTMLQASLLYEVTCQGAMPLQRISAGSRSLGAFALSADPLSASLCG